MELLIIPYQRIGKIYLNSTFQDIKHLYPSENIEMQANKVFLDGHSLQIEFVNDLAAYIGITQPSKAIYNGINLLDLTFLEILQLLSRDSNIYMEPGVLLHFLDTGLCFYSDDMEHDTKPQQVAIFLRGYYDSVLNEFIKVTNYQLD